MPTLPRTQGLQALDKLNDASSTQPTIIMSSSNTPVLKVQPLTPHDGAKNAIRHIGQKRRHIFTECNHSVEDDHCMYPPVHTIRTILQTPRTSTVVRFRGLCNNCEERFLIRRAIMEETKKLVQDHMEGFMSESQARSLTEGSVKWAKNKLIVDFKYKKMGQQKTQDDEWGVFPVTVSAAASNPSRTGGYQWEEVYVDISSSPSLIHARFDIQTHMYKFERKWNEPVRESSGSRGSFANRSSETDFTSVFPPFPESLPQAARILEEHYRFDDPDLPETLPYATPEDFNAEIDL